MQISEADQKARASAEVSIVQETREAAEARDNILALVKSKVGDTVFADVLECIKESGYARDFTIAPQPKGTRQDDEYSFGPYFGTRRRTAALLAMNSLAPYRSQSAQVNTWNFTTQCNPETTVCKTSAQRSSFG